MSLIKITTTYQPYIWALPILSQDIWDKNQKSHHLDRLTILVVMPWICEFGTCLSGFTRVWKQLFFPRERSRIASSIIRSPSLKNQVVSISKPNNLTRNLEFPISRIIGSASECQMLAKLRATELLFSVFCSTVVSENSCLRLLGSLPLKSQDLCPILAANGREIHLACNACAWEASNPFDGSNRKVLLEVNKLSVNLPTKVDPRKENEWILHLVTGGGGYLQNWMPHSSHHHSSS